MSDSHEQSLTKLMEALKVFLTHQGQSHVGQLYSLFKSGQISFYHLTGGIRNVTGKLPLARSVRYLCVSKCLCIPSIALSYFWR